MADEEKQEEKYRKALQRRLKEMQLEQQKKEIIKKFMTPEAYERFMNVRVANHDLYAKLTDWILAMAQSNKIDGRITEEQLREILSRLTYRPDAKIEFKHK